LSERQLYFFCKDAVKTLSFPLFRIRIAVDSLIDYSATRHLPGFSLAISLKGKNSKVLIQNPKFRIEKLCGAERVSAVHVFELTILNFA